jgi:hypothetical protein
MVNDADGVFVSPVGDDALGGSRLFPVKSLGVAIDRAGTLGRSSVYILPGVYSGNVIVPRSLSLLGGWSNVAGSWRRNCAPDARTTTVIVALDAGPAVSVVDAGVLLRSMSLQTLLPGASAPNTSGASRVGLWAENANVTLAEVMVMTTDALPGGVASPGAGGAAPSAQSCFGSCGNGLAAAPAGASARASDGGVFTTTGFVPGDGVVGRPGGDGQNGIAGTSGSTSSGCYLGCGCSVNCTSTGPSVVVGQPGWCGCAGHGGNGGSQGRGGGASVGIYAVGSVIRLFDTSVGAGRGGDGSAGAQGGAGSLGTDGGTGVALQCQTKPCRVTTGSCAMYPNVACYYGNSPSDEVAFSVAPGFPGGPGGAGAIGQQGGSGAGGPSVAVVLVRGGQLVVDGGTLTASNGGSGGQIGRAHV